MGPGLSSGYRDRSQEEGYTLVETLVAMSLFLGVLLPTVGLIAGFLFDRIPNRTAEALLLAQSEISRTTGAETGEIVFASGRGFVVRRLVAQEGSIREITVAVCDSSDAKRMLVVLHRSTLAYSQ